MSDRNAHRVAVQTWLDEVVDGQSSASILRLFEAAFAAMWKRAQRPLGDITLMAIVDRVLYDAVDRHPLFSGVTLEPHGLNCDLLRQRADSLAPEELFEAIRFFLVEFLSVLGNLTAEILSQPLHAELAKVTHLPPAAASQKAKQ